MNSATLSSQVADLGTALPELSAAQPDLAATMARTVETTAREAQRSPRFAAALTRALSVDETGVAPPKRTGRRAPGVLDPFAIYAESGEDGLRDRLKALSLEQLRDIVAEHGIDHDRLAMKWKTPDRVVERIVDKVRGWGQPQLRLLWSGSAC